MVREIRRHFYLNSNDMTKAEQPKRKAGRPKGAHDKKPRQKMNPADKKESGHYQPHGINPKVLDNLNRGRADHAEHPSTRGNKALKFLQENVSKLCRREGMTKAEVQTWETFCFSCNKYQLKKLSLCKDVPLFVLNLLSAINHDTINGDTKVFDKLRDRIYGKDERKITLQNDSNSAKNEVRFVISDSTKGALEYILGQKMTEAEKRKAEAIDIDSDLFDEEIEEEEPAKETAPTEIIEVKATEVDSTKLEDKKDE